jgi:hypothetical protein
VRGAIIAFSVLPAPSARKTSAMRKKMWVWVLCILAVCTATSTGMVHGQSCPDSHESRDVGISSFSTIGTIAAAPAATPSEDEIAASAVLSRNAWVRKIPHVVGMGLEFVNGGFGILVTVDTEDNIREVEGQVPSQLEGFPVEVSASHVDGEFL